MLSQHFFLNNVFVFFLPGSSKDIYTFSWILLSPPTFAVSMRVSSKMSAPSSWLKMCSYEVYFGLQSIVYNIQFPYDHIQGFLQVFI